MIVQNATKPKQGATLARRFLLVAIYLIALNFLTGNMGSFSPELNDFFALGALAAFIIAYFPLQFRGATLKENLTTVFLMGIAALAYRHGDVFKTIAISIFVFALNQRLPRINRKTPELFFLLITTIIYSIFLILYQYVPAVWLALQGLSGFISQIMHGIIPQGIDYGATYSGLKITVIIWIFCLVVLILTGKKKIVGCTSVTLSIIFVNIIYVLLHSLAMLRLAGLNSTLYARFINFQFVGFFFLLPFVYVCLRVAQLNTYSRDLRAKRSSYIALAAILPLHFLQNFF